MSPTKDQWDDEGSDAESSAGEAPVRAIAPRRKFDDEEDEEEVLDSWDAAEDDSEVERKAKVAAEAKAKADAEAAANKKSKAERIAAIQAERARLQAEQEAEESEDEETDTNRRLRLLQSEKDSDLKHAEDLFGAVGSASGQKVPTAGAAVVISTDNPHETVNIASLPLFNPITKTQFEQLHTTLVPILAASSKKPHYILFLQEFTKQLAKELPSDQIKKIASTLTALSNERLKEEKAADKTTKKSKAAKTKTSLVTSRANAADTNSYGDDAFGNDDFM